MITDLLAALMDEIDLPPTINDGISGSNEARACDGCGEAKPDVDLWAANDVTCESIWLCEACGC